MTISQTHIIQKQTLELSGSSFQLVHRLESDSQRLISSVINPIIENCFAGKAYEGIQMMIGKIELDLGTFHSIDFEREIASRLRTQLSQVLQEQEPVALQTVSSSGNKPLSDPTFDTRTLKRSDVIFEALISYLRSGQLPWWWNDEDNPRERWHQIPSGNIVPDTLQCLKEYRSAIPRAIDVLSDMFLGLLIQEAGYGKAILQGWNEIQGVGGIEPFYINKTRGIYWEYCLARITGHLRSIHSTTSRVVDSIHKFTQLTRQELEFFFSKVFAVHHVSKGPYFQKQGRTDSPEDIPSIYMERMVDDSEGLQIPAESRLDLHEASLYGSDSKAELEEDVKKSMSQIDSRKKTPDVDVYVPNGGIVIAHPFLEELFRVRDLIRDGRFISRRTQCHAVRLIDFLISGHDQSPEYQLLLPKLLCGLPWDEPIAHDIILSQEDTEACDQLLAAIVTHWKALGKSSIDGLREGFIRRYGILARHEEDWRLRMEQLAQDILIERLPWSFSTIRLPWMNATLYVSWTK